MAIKSLWTIKGNLSNIYFNTIGSTLDA